jgi:two-component system response regulator LytT
MNNWRATNSKYLLDSVGGVDVVGQGTNGIEAVDLIEEHHPDLVFLDVQMPGLDGFAVIKKLQEKSVARARTRTGADAEPLPHIVFATAYDQYAVRAFDVNAVDYLLKPFDRGRVAQAVERVKRADWPREGPRRRRNRSSTRC